MFLLVPAYPGCPGSKAVKRSLLLLHFEVSVIVPSVIVTVNLNSTAVRKYRLKVAHQEAPPPNAASMSFGRAVRQPIGL